MENAAELKKVFWDYLRVTDLMVVCETRLIDKACDGLVDDLEDLAIELMSVEDYEFFLDWQKIMWQEIMDCGDVFDFIQDMLVNQNMVTYERGYIHA